MKTTLFVAVLALVMASAAPTTADTPTTLFVADGETQTLAGSIYVDEVYIYGTLVAASDLTILADVIHIAGTASVEGTDGNPAPGSGDGANVAFIATTALTVAGTVTAGNGADMPASTGIAGADGGEGGSILFQAPRITVLDSARMTPGAGGAGGTVYVTVPHGNVQGGNGGDAGEVILDGFTTIPDNSSVFGAADGGVGGQAHVTDSPPGILVRGGNGGNGALMATTDTSFLLDGPTGYKTFSTGMAQSDLPWSLEPEKRDNGKVEEIEDLIESIPTDNPCDGDCFKNPCPTSDCVPDNPCQPATSCVPEELLTLCEPVNTCVPCYPLAACVPDNPCSPTTACTDPVLEIAQDYLDAAPDCGTQNTAVCVLALVGIEDEDEGCGRGADGAPSSNTGLKGGAGGNGAGGKAGLIGGPGGTGGAGQTGGLGEATGGKGGDGRCWFASGGDGGDGTGTGGEGGNGGDGGTGGSSTTFGGPGGNGGTCGNGGAGKGVGGQGGKGGWLGSPGKPGKSISNPGGPGVGGKGGEGGQGTIATGPSGAGGGCNIDI